MPRKSVEGSAYPIDWKAIALQVKEAADWTCVRCKARHDPPRHILTVHHGDMDPSHSGPEYWWNLWPLCARCHLSIQHRVNLDRPWVMAEHSEWFRVFAAGWYAWKYLGQTLSREDVEARLDELLALERAHVLGELASTGPPGLALVGGTM